MPIPRRPLLGSLLAAAALACGARRSDAEGPRRPLRLLLNWFPEMEHGGYYAALVGGHFRDAGLDVEIVPGRPDAPVLPQLASQRADFGVADASEVLLARAQGAPVVAVFAALQRSPRCILVHRAAGIHSLGDLRDLKLAVAAREPFAHFIRARFPLPGVEQVPYSGSVAPFLVDPRLAQQAYLFSEPLVVRRRGGDAECILVADAGFDPYTSLLVTHAERITADPDLVARMVTASQRGWQDYLRDPAPANAAIAAQNPEMDPDLLREGAAALAPLARPDTGLPLGAMSDERWRTLHAQLVELGLLGEGVDPAAAVTARCIPGP